MRAYIYDDATLRFRGRLPHVDVATGVYFVTFCLADALTPQFIHEMDALRRSLSKKRIGTTEIERAIRRETFDELDLSRGSCVLARPDIAEIAVSALRYFNEVRYRLIACTLMPNHVHVAFRSTPEFPWWKILGSWKGFVAHEANLILDRRGTFWQEDNWDRLVRNDRHLDTTVRYILENPSKGGLNEWKWVEQLVFPPWDEVLPEMRGCFDE